MESRIDGVVFKELVTHADPRGFFREIIRKTDSFFTDGFGQWSHSLMLDGVIKAWHYHRVQTDYFYVVSGVVRVGLYDLRKESATYRRSMDFLMGEVKSSSVVKIPPGVAHGVRTIRGPVHLLYMMTHVYDPNDEVRLPYNDPSIDFDWGPGELIQ